MASEGIRYTEDQIIRILKQIETETSIGEICRKHEGSEQTVYRWRYKYGGLATSEVQRLRELESENGKREQPTEADCGTGGAGHRCAERGGRKKMVSPRVKRDAVAHLKAARGLSERRACRLVGVNRSSLRYQAHTRTDEAQTVELVRAYAHEHPMYGYRVIAALLWQAGHRLNKKRVYRIWRTEGLHLPRRAVVKRRYGEPAKAWRRANHPNDVWTYDFVEARTERGGRLPMSTVLDEYTRECLAIQVEQRMSSQQVLKVLEWLFLTRGQPAHLRSDNGSEFVAHAVQQWLAAHHCQTLYITPGSPWENPVIERFNGTFRADCLKRSVFANGQEAREVLEQWRIAYNHQRPHSSLGYQTPDQFARQGLACAGQPLPTAHFSHSTWLILWGQDTINSVPCDIRYELRRRSN